MKLCLQKLWVILCIFQIAGKLCCSNYENMQNKRIMIKQSQYWFANISAAKARIFIKFETLTHRVVNNHQKSLVKIRAHMSAHKTKTCTCTFHRACMQIRIVCVRVYMDLYKTFFVVFYYPMSLSFKFYKALDYIAMFV